MSSSFLCHNILHEFFEENILYFETLFDKLSVSKDRFNLFHLSWSLIYLDLFQLYCIVFYFFVLFICSSSYFAYLFTSLVDWGFFTHISFLYWFASYWLYLTENIKSVNISSSLKHKDSDHTKSTPPILFHVHSDCF